MSTQSPATKQVSGAISTGFTKGEMKQWLDAVITKAMMADEPTLNLIAHRGRWLIFVADARTAPLRYYICDTDRLDDRDENRKKAGQFLDDFAWVSGGQINRSNTVYLALPMQRHTPDSSYPIAYWVRGRMYVRMKLERTRSIRDLFQDCFNEWRIVTVNRKDLQMDLVFEVREEIARYEMEHSAQVSVKAAGSRPSAG